MSIMDFNLDSYRVLKAPNTVFYIPDYVSVEEERLLIDNINSAPKPKWTQLSNRRLQNWGGVPHPKGMIAEKLPQWLADHTQKVGHLGLFKEHKAPNHVLINEYLPGQGIMPHLDGPLFYPTVTTISCGSHTMLDFYKQEEENRTLPEHTLSLLLERRSLLVLQDEMYHKYLHTIAEVDSDAIRTVGDGDTPLIANLDQCSRIYEAGEVLKRGVRISLTMRYVAHTTKFHIKLSR